MAVRISSPIRMDGILDEAAWRETESANHFVQSEPHDGDAATEQTDVKVLYDRKNLYIGVQCHASEQAGVLVNSLKEDFAPAQADSFELILDTFRDQRNGFLFITNPRGAKRDVQVSNEGGTINADWDTVWDVRAQTNGDGWTAELVIPFKSLNFDDSRAEQVWGINFSRRIRRKNEIDFWSPVPRRYDINHVVYAGELRGLQEIERGRNLKLKPFAVANALQLSGEDHVTKRGKGGMDAKYSITPALTLDLTANTDFSQVEVDEQQVNLTRFPLFFPEKREFFLENDGIFQFGDVPLERGPDRSRETQLFFSRRIGIFPQGHLREGEPIPIWGGARLSGRIGDTSLGVLSMQAKRVGDPANANGQPGNNFSVVRVKRNILGHSDIGAIFTNRQASEGGGFNRAWGVDGNFRFWKNLTLNGYLAQTKSEGVSGEDRSRKVSMDWHQDLLRQSLLYAGVDRNFRPELGFTQRTATRNLRSRTEVYLRPRRNSIVRQFRPHVYYTFQMDLENRPIFKEGHYALIDVVFQNGAGFEIFYNNFYDRLDEPFRIRSGVAIPPGTYPYAQWVVEANSDASRFLSTDLQWKKGSFYSGDINSIRLGSIFRPGYRFSVENRYNYNGVALPEGSFRTHLFSTRANYYFSTRMFLSAFIQYNSDRKQVTSNIRLNFIHHPLSDLFLVYNEAREVSGARRNDRGVTLKYTRLFAF